MTGPRDVAVSAVNAVLQKGVYSDTVLDILLSRDETAAKSLSQKDRALSTELTYGVLRNLKRIDFILSRFSKRPLESLDDKVLNILRVALYQIVFLEKIPPYAAVNEAVELAAIYGKRSAGSFINGVLRSALRSMDGIEYPDEQGDPAGFLSVYYSLPEWLSRFFIDNFGYETAKAIAGTYSTRPPVAIRTNVMRLTRGELLEVLIDRGFDAASTRYSPHGIIVNGGGALFRDELYLDGSFTLQDEASQLVPIIVDPKPEMRILDLCSAPGIKGTFISELMEDGGFVLSIDINEGRAGSIAENAKRLGIGSLKTVVADSNSLPLRESELFDLVLVDPPCSGLGTLRRNPEIKWRLKEKEIETLIENQRSILKAAAGRVKRGGALVYCVCTINPAEGIGVVEDFLKEHGDFSFEDVSDYLGEGTDRLVSKECLFTPPQVFDDGVSGNIKAPGDSDCPDGFFAARLKRLG
ncbi:MAG: 16S rRNA (cytosine(967)-C(5))-methyltransferase RsmB [Deltaproteobacteria bacterium]|uniref:16S rRNA (cytosine(967)-C(5))-methyltransferase n=1 Tax=Candidatus Zymogenus saltonus TaxID=2844893 RepID=A0A9D8KF49_9DELT|nr:16S rRNA (cytosine(967)-C(5))-methyltransferase RsmB [Candidatus Zymogenus saltonus]